MFNTPVHIDPGTLPVECRLHARRQVGGLGYRDIGDDNGGIVLNLSEDGMSLQAVGPLESQSRVTLRIQVPGSQTSIETAALVVWVSESKRQVGVRFVDLFPEARSRICEWMGTQILPFSGSAPQPPETANELQQEQAVVYREKWLNLMAKSGKLAPANRARHEDPFRGLRTHAKEQARRSGSKVL